MKKTLNALICLLLVGAMGAPRAAADEAIEALKKYDKPVDAAIDKALSWLAAQQHKEGYWPSGLGKDPAITSLAVMAFLAKGHTPGNGPYGERINRGIDFVLGCAKPNGMLVAGSATMYIHGISTLMLSEVSGMVDRERQDRIDKVLPHAVRLILTAQQVKKAPQFAGGWRYTPQSGDSDISLTGWSLMALRSARGNGALVPKDAIDKAVEFVLRCRPAGAKVNRKDPKAQPIGFAYQPGGPSGLARTGVALLCLELCGRHRSDDALDAGDYVLGHLPRNYGEAYFYYSIYYCSQGMFQLGGSYWEKWAPHLYEMMLKFQSKDGSWRQGASGEAPGGTCYSTAISVLALTVSYRQLPIYQR